jgi:hypothetical protein
VFEKIKATSDEGSANLLVAETQLAEGRVAEARKSVAQVIAVAAATHNRELELSAQLAAARIRVASRNSTDVNESIAALDHVIVDATAAKFAYVAMEARLALGELQIKFGDRAAGCALLETLELESSRAGLLLMARRAAAVLHAPPARAST